jgi:U6 snRNA-associated Sm-like protein LSm6
VSTLSGVQRSTCLESLPTLPTFAPHLTMDSASPEPQGADGVIAGSPSDFLKNIVGHRVKVRIGSGVDYHGESGRPCPGGVDVSFTARLSISHHGTLATLTLFAFSPPSRSPPCEFGAGRAGCAALSCMTLPIPSILIPPLGISC